MTEVVSINRSQAIALLDDGTVCPVTDWISKRGKACKPKNAVACIAESKKHGWVVIDLAAFDDVATH